MKEIIKQFKDKKHGECQRNGLVITGKYYQVSINAFYSLMDELEQFANEATNEEVKNE